MSIPRSLEPLLLLTLALLCAPAGAVRGAGERSAQLERIAREQAQVERESRAAQSACARRFAVTACVDRVKAERSERLQRLARERAVIDNEERKQRAAARLAQLEPRSAGRAQERAAAANPPASTAAAGPTARGATPDKAARSPEAALKLRQAAASQAHARAAQRAQASALRVSRAAAYRAAIEERNRERAKLRTPAAPLPLPPQAAASR